MTASDRRRALLAGVYGRDPDPAAVSALRELLGAAEEPEPTPAARPRRRASRLRLAGATVLAAVAFASAAWGIGAVSGRPAATPRAASPSTARPITVFTASGSGTTTVVDASTGQVLTQTGPLPSCSPTELEHPATAVCRAVSAFQQGSVARARQAGVDARR